MMIYKNIEQGTDEWFEVRKLKMTASNATAIGNAGAGLTTYIRKLVLESIIPQERKTSKDIERGNELEPLARMAYEFEKRVEVEEVGFIQHTKHSGCSPDGLVGEEGLIEIKARNDDKHLALILTQKLESDVIWQMQMQMLCSGRKWCDFVSFNPNFKQSLFIKRVERDEAKIEKLKHGIEKGTQMLKDILNNKEVKIELS